MNQFDHVEQNDLTDGFEPLKLREMIRENREFREHALQESDGGSLEDDVKVCWSCMFMLFF